MEDGTVNVGTIEQDDFITSIHLSTLLRSHGIHPRFEGGMGWESMFVPQSKAKLCKELLQEDASKHEYWIGIAGEPRPRKPANIGWHELNFGSVASQGDMKRKVLPYPIRAVVSTTQFKAVLKRKPKLRARWRIRRYLNKDHHMHTGYEVKLILEEPLARKPREISYQILSDNSLRFPSYWDAL
jgi:hypothetical protein